VQEEQEVLLVRVLLWLATENSTDACIPMQIFCGKVIQLKCMPTF